MAEGTQAFMFESSLSLALTDWARQGADPDYPLCWTGLQKHFKRIQPI